MIDVMEFERRRLVWLLWTYLALLIGEGALRKWVFPGWSDVLLIVRDPIAVAIIVLAVRSGFLVLTGQARNFAMLGIAFLVLALFQLGTDETTSLPVLAFGLRTYLLHPPLIFVMGRVLNGRDLRRMSLAIMLVMVPVAFLMVEQFSVAPTDWINRGAGEGRGQILSALGHVRPPGPFSFISGPVLLYALGLACLIGTQFGRGGDLLVARYAGWAAVVIAGAVSGSRSFVVGLAPVCVAALAASIMRPQTAGRFLRGAAIAALIATFVWSSTVVQDGITVFNARLEMAEAQDNLFERAIGSYGSAVTSLTSAPLFGYGLGLGTNAGAALLGAGVFRLGEDEWMRTILEAGPIFGLAYLLWRFWLVVWLTRVALRAASLGHVLAILYLGATVTNLISGNWGQSTTQGFAVWGAGMALAACRLPHASSVVATHRAAVKVGAVGRTANAAAYISR